MASNTQILSALRRAVARAPQQNQFVARVRSLAQRRAFASGPSSSSAGQAQDKAKQALEGAQKGLERAAEVAKRLGGGVGERVGSLLGGYREPLMYNLSVAREVLKQVYVAERLAPPTSFSTITSAYQTLWARASNPGYWREILNNGDWQRVGVYVIEAYGIFKVGEILGRRHLIGYKLD